MGDVGDVGDVCDVLVQSLLPPVGARLSKHCEQVRLRVVMSGCAGSLEFTKALAGALVGALKVVKRCGGLECVGTCMRWLRASAEVVRACGSRLLGEVGMGGGEADKISLQIVQAMIQGQDVVVGAMLRRGRLVGRKSRKVLRCMALSEIASNKEVMGMYASYCTRKDASGFGLVGLVWDALVESQNKTGKENDAANGTGKNSCDGGADDIQEVQNALFQFYLSSVLTSTSRKEAPTGYELECFASLLGSLSTAQIEKEFVPAAIRMAKRSPEASMAIANHALVSMANSGCDLSGCGIELMPLVVQQARHGKETVRGLAQEMMVVLARGTKDAGVLRSYGDMARDALLSKDANKLKTPQERYSMAKVLRATVPRQGAGFALDPATTIPESICQMIQGEVMADTKVVLIRTLAVWMVPGTEQDDGSQGTTVPASFGSVAEAALAGPEAVRRAMLGLMADVCDLGRDFAASLAKFAQDGAQKASVRWDGLLAASCLLKLGMASELESSGVLGGEVCPYLQMDVLKGLSSDNAARAARFSHGLLASDPRPIDMSSGVARNARGVLVMYALHYDASVRRTALSCVKDVCKDCKRGMEMLDSLRSVCDDARTLEFVNPSPGEVAVSAHAIHERFLTVLLECVPRRSPPIPGGTAAALCVLAHHPMMARGRGAASAWRSVLASCDCAGNLLIDGIREDIQGVLSVVLDDVTWGIDSKDRVIGEAAMHAFAALGRTCGEELFEPFMEKVSGKLRSLEVAHEALTAKQIRVYATPFGKATNESEEGGLIPAELMEQMLLDKTSIIAPVFHPTHEQAVRFLKEYTESAAAAKGRKEDPAAAARKAQMVQEAEVRLGLVELRDDISQLLLAIGSFASGARTIVCELLPEVTRPCLTFLSSPLLGERAALECLNLIIACIPGIIGRSHTTLGACFHLIRKEEAKPTPNYDAMAASPFLEKAADVLVRATVEAEPRTRLSPQIYAFLFPIANAILRSSRPTVFHRGLLEFIELHAEVSSPDLSPEDEFSLLFHVLEVVPALKSTAQDLLTKLCSESDDGNRAAVFAAAAKGVLISQTSSRLAALSAMNNSSENLFKASINDHTQSLVWIACNDVDEDVAAAGGSIWERSGCVVSATMIDHIVQYCSSDALEVRKSSCKALGVLVGSLREGDTPIVSQTLKRVTCGMYAAGTALPRRLGTAECLKELGIHLAGEDVFASLEFLLAQGFLDKDADVRTSMMAAGVAVIGGSGAEQAELILPIMERYLENPKDRGLSEEQYDYVRLGAVVCIGATAQHLDPSNPKVVSIVNTLLDVLMTPSEVVQRSVSDRLPPLIKSLMAINKTFIEETVAGLLKTCLGGETYGDRRGAAYGLSGCVKGLGLSCLKSLGIMEALKGGVEDKKDTNAREGGLLAFECLSSNLGRLFEPYVIQILPMLLASLGDGKVEVREAADTASRVIMSQLTAQGVKLVLPSLLGGAEEKQWRAKQGSIQLLGSMAYCAPKQLGSCLPQIVPVLGEALADPHPKVSAAAKDAMDEVGAVIKNPEVAKLVPTLMAALADPNKHNKKALDTLLSTIFVNTVDSASLALIIPVVHRGLRDRSGDVKKRAARIVGNLCTLMNDPKDMSPYLPSLMPELQGALIDPLPEVRGAAAKALGALTKGMSGLQASAVVDISPWLLDTMRSESSSVERSGAAQGLAEIIAVKGATYLDQMLPEIFASCDSKSAATREGSITLFKYLPHCMTEDFQTILPEVLPRVLGGLADESEGVREASFAAGSVAVDLYAKTSLPLVLPAVEAGAADGNWRIRQSSIELLGDLLFKVAGTSGRIQQDLNDDESEGISVESHGQAIIEVLGLERRNDVLARLYLARADVAYTVRTAALHVWKTIVTNTPKTLVEILPVLMARVITGLSHSSEEQRNSSGQCLGELVKKLGDRVLPRIVPILMEGAHSEDSLIRVGVLNGMREVTSNASKTQLTEFMADILTEIQRLLCDEDEQVRQSAGGALEVIFKTGGGSAADSVIPSLLNGLQGDDERVSKSLEGLRVVLSVRPQLLGVMVPRLVEPPLSKTDIVALGALSEVSGEAIHNYLSKILPPLFRMMHDQEEDIEEATAKTLLGVVMAVEEDGIHLLVQQFNRGFDTPESTYGACVAVRLFCKNTDLDFQEQIGGMLATLVPLLADDSSERRVKAAWDALAAVTEKIPKEMAPSYVRPMKDAFTSARERMIRRGAQPSSCMPGLLLPKALSPFLTTYLQGILQGSSAELRELAAEAIGELVQLTDEATLKPFVIQITGPLIRIVGDKFPPHTKTAILRTMGILVDKAGLALRPFIPQLQTTFVKCLPDPARDVRLQGARNLGTLSKMAPRLDQLVVDTSSSCISADIDGPKEAYLAALAAILHESGDKLKEETMERVAEAIVVSATEAIHADSETVVKHAAMALGEYSLHCSASEFDRLMNHDGFGPLATPLSGLGSRLCTVTYASLVAPLAATKLKGALVPFLDSVTKLSQDNSVDVRMTAAVAAGRVVLSEPSTLAKAMSLFLALLGPDQHVECQKQTMAILRAIANAMPEALVPHFVALVPTLIGSTKTSTGATKLAAERTLATVLRLSIGEERYVREYLDGKDTGAVAKTTLSEAYTRRLVRICDGATDDLVEYNIGV